ncbi:MAG TPA: helix-turn-helix domain-containing protein [Actinomycetota bacterium]|nr:helix-turn-helix domain-containing protein [Actinomycetota bacterium]
MPVGDDQSVKAARALALPTRSAILAHLLRSGSLTAKEVADEFSLHPNVARAHLDLLVEAGFLATGVRRKRKGRPAKVYFTWEGEMGALEDWEVSPPTGVAAPEVEMLEAAAEPLPSTPPSPYRLIAAILIRMVERLDDPTIYSLAEQVAREEGRKLMLGYRGGGLDFAAAVRALVEELGRFSPQAQIVRLDHDYAEIETPDCPFRDIALEHPDLVAVMDPALKEGAMAALGHPSDVETEASVARGDPWCREIIRRRVATEAGV